MAVAETPHIVSGEQFTPEILEPIFARAIELRAEDTHNDLRQRNILRRRNAQRFVGARAVNLFYGESTRTRTSFEMAEAAWGIGKSSTADAKSFSSAAKGETLAHTMEVIARYNPDFIVLRSGEGDYASEVASFIDVPIINAGDGGKVEEREWLQKEHPTQAELDAFTIKDEIGRLDNLNITFMGDLKHGRTIRSLVHVLTQYAGNSFRFVSHPDFKLSDDIRAVLDASCLDYVEFDDATAMDGEDSILKDTDVLYVTRTQTNLGATKLDENDFKVTKDRADLLPEHGIFMHPMPIDRSDLETTEIVPEVDYHPRSRFFDQAGNGMYIRMANIEDILAVNWPDSITGYNYGVAGYHNGSNGNGSNGAAHLGAEV